MGRVYAWSLLRAVAPMVVVAALLISGCSLLPSVAGSPSFQAASLAAPDAWSFTDLTMRPSIQQALYAKDVFDLYSNLPGLAGTDLKQLPTPSGRPVDFEKDVLPHLDGELAVAVSGTVDKPRAVLLVHTDDVNNILHLVAQERAPVLTKDARGAIRYDSGTFLAAGYKNWVVYGEDPDLVEQTLDRIDGKGGDTLAAQSRYKAVVDRLTGDRLGFGYLDVTPLLDSPELRNTSTVDLAKARGRIAYSLAFGAGPEASLRALDLRFEFMLDTPTAQPVRPKGDALSAMDQLPKADVIAFSGSSLGFLVDQLTMVASTPVPDEVQTFLRAFSGPYAVGVSPMSGGTLNTATDFLGSLSFLGKLAPGTDVETLQADATAIMDGAVSSTDKYQYQVLTDGGWMAINVVPSSVDIDQLPQDELASDRVYQSIRPILAPDGVNGYVNIHALVAWAQDQSDVPGDELAALSSLQAVATSSVTESDGSGHGRLVTMISLTS